jgi:hypothetical protein
VLPVLPGLLAAAAAAAVLLLLLPALCGLLAAHPDARWTVEQGEDDQPEPG